MNKKSSRGFTIVELLVVIVVIGILAAITIVSYAGITARANTTKAQSDAQSIQSVAEVMNADNGSYPKLNSALGTGSATTKLPASVVSKMATSTNALSGTYYVKWEWCGSTNNSGTSDSQGGRITYWDYSGTPGPSSTVLYVGTGSAAGGAGSGTTCNTYFTNAS